MDEPVSESSPLPTRQQNFNTNQLTSNKRYPQSPKAKKKLLSSQIQAPPPDPPRHRNKPSNLPKQQHSLLQQKETYIIPIDLISNK